MKTIGEMFEIAPKSERTLIKHGFKWAGHYFINDVGHPCEYRVVAMTNIELGLIKYYRGRLLSCYEKVSNPIPHTKEK